MYLSSLSSAFFKRTSLTSGLLSAIFLSLLPAFFSASASDSHSFGASANLALTRQRLSHRAYERSLGVLQEVLVEHGPCGQHPRGRVLQDVSEVGDPLSDLRTLVHRDQSRGVPMVEVVLQVVDDVRRVDNDLAGVLEHRHLTSGVQVEEPRLVLLGFGQVHPFAVEGEILLVQGHHHLSKTAPLKSVDCRFSSLLIKFSLFC
jgi:hypothetical protein